MERTGSSRPRTQPASQALPSRTLRGHDAAVFLPFTRNLFRVHPHAGDGRPDARGRGQQARKTPRAQGGRQLARRAMGDDAPRVHDGERIGAGKQLLRALLCHENRRAQLAVHPHERVEEVPGRDGVELRTRFVEHDKLGFQRHGRSQAQQLLLPAGQLPDACARKALHPEESAKLRDARAHGLRLHAGAFHAEGQLACHRVGHNLRVDVLHDKADARRLLALIQIREHNPVEEHAPAAFTRRHKGASQMAQKRRLAAAARPGKAHEGAAIDRKRHPVERRHAAARVAKAQILDSKKRHLAPSNASTSTGRPAKAESAPKSKALRMVKGANWTRGTNEAAAHPPARQKAATTALAASTSSATMSRRVKGRRSMLVRRPQP